MLKIFFFLKIITYMSAVKLDESRIIICGWKNFLLTEELFADQRIILQSTMEVTT